MKTDADYLAELHCLMDRQHNFLATLSIAKKYRDLKLWVIEKTNPLLDDDFYTLGNRIFYILNDFHSLPKCANPNCDNFVKTNFTVYTPKEMFYRQHCCVRCVQFDPYVKRKIETTTFKRYKCKRGRHDEEVHNKIKESFINKYGVDNPLLVDEIKQKREQTCLRKYGTKYAISSDIVRDKIKKTINDKYGVDSSLESPIIQEKIKNTVKEKYGVDHIAKSPIIRQQIEQSLLNRFGSTSYLGTKECLEKTKQYYKHNFGVEWVSDIPGVREKMKQTNIERYGHEYAYAYGTPEFDNLMLDRYGRKYNSQIPEFQQNRRTKYKYNNIYFDSKPEIAFYIWLTDVKDILGIDFIYKPKVSFPYYINYETRYYIPDFQIGDQFFEIKGDHFFKDGKMINPFRYKHWSDEYYQQVCEIYEAKHQCMIKNGVSILRNSCYNFFIDYVNENYGDDYLDKYKALPNDKNIDLPDEFFGYTQEQILDVCLKSDFPGTEKWSADNPIWDCNVFGKMSPKQAWSDINMLKSAIKNLFKILHKSINIGPKFYPDFANSVERAFNAGGDELCRCVLTRFTVAKIAPKVTALKPDIFEKIIEESGVDISCGVYCPMAGFGGIIEGARRWFKKHNLPENIEAYDINKNFCNYYGWTERDAIAQTIITDKVVVACPPFGNKTEHWLGTPDDMYYDFHDWCKLLKEHIIATDYIFIGPEEYTTTPTYKTGTERPSLFRKKIGIQFYPQYLKGKN